MAEAVSHVNVAAFALVRGVSEFPTEADRVGLKSETLLHMLETSICAVGSRRSKIGAAHDLAWSSASDTRLVAAGGTLRLR